MTDRIPAEVFPPGGILREELDARGWTQSEFAEIIDRPIQAVSEILNAKKEITPETAISFSEALGTSAEFWLNLQMAYKLHLQRVSATSQDMTPVARRARLRGRLPLAEVRSRGWIPDSTDLDVTEAAVCELLEVPSLDDPCQFLIAARRSNTDEPVSDKQVAWLGHVRQMAEKQDVGEYNRSALESLAADLPRAAQAGPDVLPRLPGLLGECGVCLVFAEGLRGGKLDGAVTVLRDERPVIGLTTRGNRFDSVLYTLLHECAHLTLGHVGPGPDTPTTIYDDDLFEESEDAREQEADEQVSEWLFPGGFQCSSMSVPSIVEAATHYEVHPSVVIGHIHYETKKFHLHRSQIPKAKPTLEYAGLLS